MAKADSPLRPGLLEIVGRHKGKPVIVVLHKAKIRLLLSSLIGFDPRRHRDNLDQDPAALKIVDFKDLSVRARCSSTTERVTRSPASRFSIRLVPACQNRGRNEFPFMKIAIGSDHAGFRYKQAIIHHWQSRGHDVTDFGTVSETPVSYVTYIRPVAEAVAAGKFERGIVLGGSGNGEAISANRVRGVRCGLCWNLESTWLARLHNDANVLAIGERMMDLPIALEIVEVFLATEFEGGRHLARIQQLDE